MGRVINLMKYLYLGLYSIGGNAKVRSNETLLIAAQF